MQNFSASQFYLKFALWLVFHTHLVQPLAQDQKNHVLEVYKKKYSEK